LDCIRYFSLIYIELYRPRISRILFIPDFRSLAWLNLIRSQLQGVRILN
jgi:hypothetical protein